MDFAKLERKVLKLWEKEKTFEKTLKARAKSPRFVFFEGPPTANGRPGIHHVLGRAWKDAVCRYKTMQGFLVERKAGWDTHGLPVELEVEKELGLKSKQDIERYGIAKFNARSKKSVWRYKDDWEKLTARIGFWLDTKNPYITYANEYIETLWWILKEVWDKGLLYEGHKVVPWCTRCGSTLSSHEVAQGYESVTENSVFIKFKLKNEPRTYILGWTTTPWTLPGNVALAVGKDIEYVKARDIASGDQYILAKAAVAAVLKESHEIVWEGKGKDLVGFSYEPLFDIAETRNEKAFTVYDADFVNTSEGTGVVHTAAMYGEDDYQLGLRVGLPTVHTVNEEGRFMPFVPTGLAGRYVKDKETEKIILLYLRDKQLLFREQAYTHDYPFCWRCKTPLLYYAKKSWFISMSKLREKLLAENEEIRWIPEHLKSGRFGEWLREVKDWAISRERFWGTPLPIWRCAKCDAVEVVGSLKELKNRTQLNNRYILVRHGEARSNVGSWISSLPERRPNPLTRRGKMQAVQAAKELSKKRVDVLISSPMRRARETAVIVAKELRLKPLIDERLQDIKCGTFNTRPLREYEAFLGPDPTVQWEKKPLGGETWTDVRKRMWGFLQDLEHRYKGKTIVVVGHGDPLFLLQGAVLGLRREEYVRPYLHAYPDPSLTPASFPSSPIRYPKNGVPVPLTNANLPLDKEGNLDLHRPFVDNLEFACTKCHGTMHRIPEVADVWFDSGSMPFAQWHYPFENKTRIENETAYPADFICEAIDQTRGWFYTLLAVATLLGKNKPYRTVISTGHVLDKNGKKMSKSLGNIVSPWDMVDRYGADTVRWYFYTVNQPGDPKRFDEADLKTAMNRFVGTLWNLMVFYETYRQKKNSKLITTHYLLHTVLDRWILSRLASTTTQVREYMDNYDLTSAGRVLEQFVLDDFSNWYVRRSRERFQHPKNKAELATALGVFSEVLHTAVLLAAPLTPFISEEITRKLGSTISPHALLFPEPKEALRNETLEKDMTAVRAVVALGHTARKTAQMRVRQPLGVLAVRSSMLGKNISAGLLHVLAQELNIKNVEVHDILPVGENWIKAGEPAQVALDRTVTAELAAEGLVRELARLVQDLRRDAKLTPAQRVRVRVHVPESMQQEVLARQGVLAATVNATTVLFGAPHEQEKFRAVRTATVDGVEVFVGILK